MVGLLQGGFQLCHFLAIDLGEIGMQARDRAWGRRYLTFEPGLFKFPLLEPLIDSGRTQAFGDCIDQSIELAGHTGELSF